MIYSFPMPLSLVLSLAVCLLAGFFRNRHSKSTNPLPRDIYFYQFVCSLLGAGVIVLTGGGFSRVEPFMLWGGILFGLTIVVQGIFQSMAFATGPWSYTTIITMLSTAIPSLAGSLFLGQPMPDAFQYVGLALLLVCFFFAVKRKEGEKRANLRWLFFVFLTFLSTGSMGVMQSVLNRQLASYIKTPLAYTDMTAFLFFGFLTSAVLALLLWLGFCLRDGVKPSVRYSLPVWGLFVGTGVCAALNHIINIHLVGDLPAIIFFPVVNGGNLILTLLLAIFVERERPTGKQWIGMGIGVVSLLLLAFFNTSGVFAPFFGS